MPAEQPNRYHKNVPPNWKPVEALAERKPGLPWSDWLWHVLVCIGGLAMMAAGVAAIAYLHLGKIGGATIGVGFIIFVLGFPSEAARKGYRSS